MKVVQERLGHASPMIATTIYAHSLPGMHEQTAARFDEMLQGGGS